MEEAYKKAVEKLTQARELIIEVGQLANINIANVNVELDYLSEMLADENWNNSGCAWEDSGCWQDD